VKSSGGVTPNPALPPSKGEGRAKYGLGLTKVLVGFVGLQVAVFTLSAVFPPDMTRARHSSPVALDHRGVWLRALPVEDGRWRIRADLDRTDDSFKKRLIAVEDARFHGHLGVDPLAVVRAAGSAAIHGRATSGASTLTMQTARLLEPRPRNLGSKLIEMIRAVQLESRLTKRETLALYLTLAPYGGNLEGVRAASLAYFGHEPTSLTDGEQALLIALPQSPEARRPDRRPEAARLARLAVLDKMVRAKVLSEAAAVEAEAEPLPRRAPFPALAWNVAGELAKAAPVSQASVISTIDADLQARLEPMAAAIAATQGTDAAAAILVVEIKGRAVRAAVGSAGRDRPGGWVDMTRALRSPGSALKPFIYALAFDNGIAHPETMLEDRPARYGIYIPENFDMTFQGMVIARKALQLSLNVPTVELLSALGPQRFLSRLRDAGVAIAMPKEGGAPGLAVGLGGLGITLQDLTRLYVGLARGGEMVPLQVKTQAGPSETAPRLVDPVAAWYVTETLLGAPPPLNAVPGRIAYKTGTSYGYRDAWAVGFDRKHTIGVWVGRADNGAVPGLVGRVVAAPILFDAFARLGLDPRPFPQPENAIVATVAHLPPPLRHLRQDVPKTIAAMTTPALKLAFPPDGAKIDLAASAADGQGQLNLKVAGGAPPYTWLVDGTPVTGPIRRRETAWQPGGKGFMRISVVDGTGASESVSVRLQ
jgi:penicillin-binding protein 1C